MSRESFWGDVGAILMVILLLVFLCGQSKAADEEVVGISATHPEVVGNSYLGMPKTEYLFDAALAADMLTTLDIKNHPNLQESNPLLGAHPSDARVVASCAAVALLHHWLIRKMIDDDAPKYIIDTVEWFGIGFEAAATAHNYSIGLRMKF